MIICNVGTQVHDRKKVANYRVRLLKWDILLQWMGRDSVFWNGNFFLLGPSKIRPPWGWLKADQRLLLLSSYFYVGQLNLHSRPEGFLPFLQMSLFCNGNGKNTNIFHESRVMGSHIFWGEQVSNSIWWKTNCILNGESFSNFFGPQFLLLQLITLSWLNLFSGCLKW